MKNDSFKSSILKSLQPKTPMEGDFVNLQDDKPTVTLGPMVEEWMSLVHPSIYP